MTAPRSGPEIAIQAMITVAWVAAPDWTSTDRRRRLARGSVLAAAGGIAAIQVVRGREEAEPEELDQAPEDLRWKAGLGVAGLALAATVGAHRVLMHSSDRGVAALRRRGVRRPHTVVALGWGVVSLAADLAERRWQQVSAERREVSPGGP